MSRGSFSGNLIFKKGQSEDSSSFEGDPVLVHFLGVISVQIMQTQKEQGREAVVI